MYVSGKLITNSGKKLQPFFQLNSFAIVLWKLNLYVPSSSSKWDNSNLYENVSMSNGKSAYWSKWVKNFSFPRTVNYTRSSSSPSCQSELLVLFHLAILDSPLLSNPYYSLTLHFKFSVTQSITLVISGIPVNFILRITVIHTSIEHNSGSKPLRSFITKHAENGISQAPLGN